MHTTYQILLLIINCSASRKLGENLPGIHRTSNDESTSSSTRFMWHDELTSILENNQTLASRFIYDDSEEMVNGKPVLFHKKLAENNPNAYKIRKKSKSKKKYSGWRKNSRNEECAGCPGPSRFRTYDGSCNHCNHPRLGQAYTPFIRLMAPAFENGIDSMPMSVDGQVLPLVRNLSANLLDRRNRRNWDYTLIIMLWSQFIAHDFARHTIRFNDEYEHIECCSEDGRYPLTIYESDRSCHFIMIPKDDNFYRKYRQQCMNFVRSLAMAKAHPTPLPIQQPNGVSSYLDLSPIYGIEDDVIAKLRTFRGGLMKTVFRAGRHVLPVTQNESKFCSILTADDICFLSGDYRVNQTPYMAILHTIFVREHNRIARNLWQLNIHWDDERIFQEARRIVIAEYQHITYHEWLPLIIGNSYYKRHGLGKFGTWQVNYRKEVNPGVINSFTSAAFRFLHSMIPGEMEMYSGKRRSTGKLRLSDHYFRPGIIERGDNFDQLLRGLVTQPTQKVDHRFNEEIAEYLFRGTKQFGMDLVSIDIKRARDHGVPGYNAHRELCGLKWARDFDDLRTEMKSWDVKKLRKIYRYVDDIDLFVGIAFETPVDDGVYGPTGRCIVTEQFYRSRVSDRYFYGNLKSPYPFTRAQLHDIKQTTLAKILCENTYEEEMQKDVFKQKSYSDNPLMDCSDFPALRLHLWKERPLFNEHQVPDYYLIND